MEYELLDTGIFDEDRYFDVVVEYAKAAPDDILMRGHRAQPRARRGDAAPAADAVVPQHLVAGRRGHRSPRSTASTTVTGSHGRRASHPELGELAVLRGRVGAAPVLRERDQQRAAVRRAERVAVRQGRHQRLRGGRRRERGQSRATAAPSWPRITCSSSTPARARRSAFGLTAAPAQRSSSAEPLGADFDAGDERPPRARPTLLRHGHPVRRSSADQAMVMRQALAGMLWSKQYYEYDVHRWLREHGVDPWNSSAPASPVRNVPWFHMVAGDIISMPDKWEYPWFAAWDLAFHCAPLSLVDVDFAKEQVELLLRTRYMHPNGQIPGVRVELQRRQPAGARLGRRCSCTSARRRSAAKGDVEFLELVFDRLLTNFTWWVNRKDPDGRNLFQGGFLGLDNIGVFDRSAPLPGGGTLEQADGTAWMALYCQWMLQIAVELAKHDRAYVDMALKFVAHFLWIAVAMNPPRGRHRAVGRAGRLLLRRDAHARRSARSSSRCARSSACCRCARRPCSTATCSSATRGWCEGVQRVHRALLRHLAARSPHAPGPNAEGQRIAGARRRGAAAADPRRDARRARVPRPARDPRDLPPSPRAPVSCSTGAARTTTCTTCRPSPTPACSAATRTGAARCGSR